MKKEPVCNTCSHIGDFPVCIGTEVSTGEYTTSEINFNGRVIISCDNHSPIEMEGTYHAE